MNTKQFFAAALATLATSIALAGDLPQRTAPTHWVPSWYASPQPVWQDSFVLPAGVPRSFEQQTVRQTVRLSVGGERLRVTVSNAFGRQPLRIGAVHVARSTQQSAIDPASDRALRFGGKAEVVVPAGASAVSDAVDLALPALSRVAVSIYLPEPGEPAGFHWDARETVYVAGGDVTAAPRMPADAQQLSARVFLTGIAVESTQPAAAIVALGDSITDGNGAVPGSDGRWPDALAERAGKSGMSVINAGISGGRLLRDGMGLSALARAQQDVFSQAGIRGVIVMLGTNDIGWPGGPFAPAEPAVTADAVIAGLRQLIAQAHQHNVRIIGATITPFRGALEGTPLEGHYSPAKDQVRHAVNKWIRSSGEFDSVADFDRTVRDPADPSRLLPAFDSGDHLHPGNTGYRAMAETINLDALAARR